MTFWIQPGDAVREEDWREVILIELCEIAKGKVSLQLEKILQKNSEICNEIGSKLREPLSAVTQSLLLVMLDCQNFEQLGT